MIDFAIPAELAELRDRTAAFVRDVIIPLEAVARNDHHGPTEDFRLELVGLARDAGLLVPHVSKEFGGLGLSHVAKALVFEESGYSLLGPVAMHIAAPDEGNMHLLEMVADPDQKERFLRPITSGQARSMFMMTEPDGGAGSDPSMMKTRAAGDKAMASWWSAVGIPTRRDQERSLHALNQIQSRLADLEEKLSEMQPPKL